MSKLISKRPAIITSRGVVFHRDKARPHVALKTRKKLLDLVWKVLHNSAYMPDIASWIYSVVLSLHNAFAHRMFNDMETEKRRYSNILIAKQRSLLIGIYLLPNRGQEIIHNDGICVNS